MAENSGNKTGGRLALCRVPRGAKRGYGVERRSTERTERSDWSAATKPYHHKPRKRRSLPTTSRLLGDSPTTGGGNVPLRGVAPSRWSGLIVFISRDSGVTHQLPCLSCWRRDKRHTTAVRRNQTLPHACWRSPTTGAGAKQPAGLFQGRYRAAIREFCRGVRDRRVLTYATGAATTARLARASENAPCYRQKSGAVRRRSSK